MITQTLNNLFLPMTGNSRYFDDPINFFMFWVFTVCIFIIVFGILGSISGRSRKAAGGDPVGSSKKGIFERLFGFFQKQ